MKYSFYYMPDKLCKHCPSYFQKLEAYIKIIYWMVFINALKAFYFFNLSRHNFNNFRGQTDINNKIHIPNERGPGNVKIHLY